jgi:mTERF domain-containing protein
MTRTLLSRKLVTIQSIVKDRTGLSESEWQISKLARERGLSRLRVRQLLRFLESRLGFDQNHLRKVVLTIPQLFRYNGVEHFQGMVCYLESEVGTKNVKLMAQRWPVIFTYGLESSIKPTVAFLKTLGESRWERMLVKYPQLLTKSVETVLQPKIDYLEQLLNIRSARQLVTIYPPLLWLPIDVLEEKFQFLQSALELTREETEIIVETFPGILGLSVEKNLRPKIRFLREELSAEQLRDFVLYQPALLAYSLQNRLRPRIEKMQSADISFAFAPAYLMSMTDAKFGQW